MADTKDDQPPEPTDKDGRLSVLIELRTTPGASAAFSMSQANALEIDGFELDHEFQPVPIGGTPNAEGLTTGLPAYLLRGTVASEAEIEKLKRHPDVAEVWTDTPIAPFAGNGKKSKKSDSSEFSDPAFEPDDNLGTGTCPIGTCDCNSGTPKGTMAEVATYLGVDQIWARGFRGAGIVVGVLDSGITAQGRPVKSGETSRRIPRVIDGWPSDWGTESSKWGDHGNMCATDVLGMAPEAQLYDLRIAGSGGSPGTISRALQAFQWAIDRHRVDGTPQVLSNSWGIWQESWDTTYARNPNHPFTRKVVEAIEEGIIVLFAAGNCGDTCPPWKCGSDTGPGSSIWGANGHPRVMTVGAVNKNEQFVGYSSQGPAALDPNKPDFCGITHFTGYNTSDSGTSAATPIVAGVCALLKQANGSLTQDPIKDCLKATAKDIGPPGFDQHSGAGIVQALAAFQRCGPRFPKPIVTDTPVVRDRITKLPPRDRITTVLRDRPTSPVRDRFTDPRGDILTTPRIDQLTSPLADVGPTNPRLDPVKAPVLDTLQERVGTLQERGGTLQERGGQPIDPVGQPGWRGGMRPFVLSTPHHAQDWEYFDEYGGSGAYDEGGGGAGESGALAAEIERLSGELDMLVAAYEDAVAAEYGQGGCCGDDGGYGGYGGY